MAAEEMQPTKFLTREEWDRHFPRPRTGGLLPSPGHEAAKAREEVAALWREVEALEARVEDLQASVRNLVDAGMRVFVKECELEARLAKLEMHDG